jgi:hypothetical protein
MAHMADKATANGGDLGAKLKWLREELQREQVALQNLEARRETVYLDGGDASALFRDLSNTQERIGALERNIAMAEKRQRAATEEAERKAVEEEVALVRETAVAGASKCLRRMYERMIGFDDDGAEYEAHLAVISATNTAVAMLDYRHADNLDPEDRLDMMHTAAGNPRLNGKKPSHPELLIDAGAIWTEVSRELAAAPELPPITPFAGEPQAAFNRRTLNRQSRIDDLARTNEPLKAAAEKARDRIEKTILARSPFENVERRVIVGPTIDPHTRASLPKARAIDGLRAPPKRIATNRPGLSPEGDAA